VPRTNYHQVRKQKELARKVRQQEKQQRRLAARPRAPEETAPVTQTAGSENERDPGGAA
jgi:hypothetical protein